MQQQKQQPQEMHSAGLPSLLFLFPLKRTSPVDFTAAAASGCGGDLPPSVAAFFQSLTDARSKVLDLLQPSPVAGTEKAGEVDVALAAYLSRINHLLLPKPGSSGNKQGLGELTLQGLVRFNWKSIWGGGGVTGNDVRFEIASILLSVAVWKARVACQFASLEDGDASKQNTSLSYKLYRESAGLVEHVLRVTNLIKESPAVDCKQQSLTGFLKSLLAEAQSLTALRAIANKNADNLIARISWDVQDLYEESISELKAGGVQAMEFLSYLEHRSASFKSIAYLFQSTGCLGKMEGGLAVRFAEKAKLECEKASQQQLVFDRASRAVSASTLTKFQTNLNAMVNEALENAKEGNYKVYMEPTPTEVPDIGRERLVFPIPFEFPVQDSTVDRAQALSANWKKVSHVKSSFEVIIETSVEQESTEEQPPQPLEKSDSSAWRWLLVILVAPILLVVSILGFLVWVILLPVKVFCCPVGCAVQLLWSTMEWIAKAPLRATLWAAGEPWKPKDDKQAPKSK